MARAQVFSPLALARWLRRYDPQDEWFLGSRSESAEVRAEVGWDAARGGGGVALSQGLMRRGPALAACLDAASWEGGSDGALGRCLSRLGVPLEHSPGFHPMDFIGDGWTHGAESS